MSKVIIGFLLGVGVTLAAVYWLDILPGETTSVPAEHETTPRIETQQGLEAVSGVAAEPNDSTDGPANGSERQSTPAIPPVVAEADESPDAQPSTAVAPTHVSDSGASNPDARPPATQNASDPSYPPEIAELIERSVDKELQARYENDEREDSWAPYMEGLLGAYFAQKPELAQFYISLIDCRTSVCSVHVVGYGPDALTQWNVATADLVSQPWFEFNNMSMNRRNPAPDVLAVVLILTKKPPT